MSENKTIKCKKLEEWLGGVPLEEKIKTLETGKMVMCKHCGLSTFDKEKPEDHIKRRCIPSGHSFVERENYIILKRGFSGIVDVVFYSFGTPEEAIILHFKRKR